MGNTKDDVFDQSIENISDFDVIFDGEDSLVDTVCGCNEAGEPLTGRDPEEEYTTDASDSKVDIEDTKKDDLDKEDGDTQGQKVQDATIEAAENTDETDKKDILADAEDDDKPSTEEANESADLDEMLGEADEVCPECGNSPCTCAHNEADEVDLDDELGDEGEAEKCNEAEENTDETDKKDILADVEDDDKPSTEEANESADLDDELGDDLEDDDIEDLDEAFMLMEAARYSFWPKFAEREEMKGYKRDLEEAEKILRDNGEPTKSDVSKIAHLVLRILDIIQNAYSVLTLPLCFILIGIPAHLISRLWSFAFNLGEDTIAKSTLNKTIARFRKLEKEAKDASKKKAFKEAADKLEKRYADFVKEAGDLTTGSVDIDEVLGEDVEGVDDNQVVDNNDGEAPKKNATDVSDEHEDEKKLESYTFDWFNMSVNEADGDTAEVDLDDELIDAADDNDEGEASMDLDYQLGLDDELIDDMIEEE